MLYAEELILSYIVKNFNDFYELVEEFNLGEDSFFTKTAKRIYQIFIESEENDIFEYISNNNEIEEFYKDLITELSQYQSDVNEKLAKLKKIDLTPKKEEIHQALLSIEFEKINNFSFDVLDSETIDLDDETFIKIMQRDSKSSERLKGGVK